MNDFAAILQKRETTSVGSRILSIGNLQKLGLLLKERICSQREQILFFISIPSSKGRQILISASTVPRTAKRFGVQTHYYRLSM